MQMALEGECFTKFMVQIVFSCFILNFILFFLVRGK